MTDQERILRKALLATIRESNALARRLRELEEEHFYAGTSLIPDRGLDEHRIIVNRISLALDRLDRAIKGEQADDFA